ncbi:hypothetical protein U1Q18_036373 [Sarracenia purpurea var. burkii]
MRSGSISVCDVSGLVDERDSAEGVDVVKEAGHNGLEGGNEMESKNVDEKDVISKKPSCPKASSKELGLPAPTPVRSSPQESAASSFRDSSIIGLFVPESNCAIDAHFGISLDFVDVKKLDDSANQGKQFVGLENQWNQAHQAPCYESVLVVGGDSKGSPGSQTGGKLEEHKACVQPIRASSWASIVASKGDPKQPTPRLNDRSPADREIEGRREEEAHVVSGSETESSDSVE